MHHFAYRDGALFAEDVDLREIAETVGTPVYVYSTATFERQATLGVNANAFSVSLPAKSITTLVN